MRTVLSIIMIALMVSCQNPIEPISEPTDPISLNKGGNVGESAFFKYSYLITAQPDTFATYFDITYYLHRDQNIAVGIYTNPPTELIQIVIGNEWKERGLHTLRIYAEPQIESGKFYWVKMIMEDRDFFTYIFKE